MSDCRNILWYYQTGLKEGLVTAVKHLLPELPGTRMGPALYSTLGTICELSISMDEDILLRWILECCKPTKVCHMNINIYSPDFTVEEDEYSDIEPGEVIALINQDLYIENGIYVYTGNGRPLKQYDYHPLTYRHITMTDMTVTSYHTGLKEGIVQVVEHLLPKLPYRSLGEALWSLGELPLGDEETLVSWILQYCKPTQVCYEPIDIDNPMLEEYVDKYSDIVPGEVIVLVGQTDPKENGVYVFTGDDSPLLNRETFNH